MEQVYIQLVIDRDFYMMEPKVLLYWIRIPMRMVVLQVKLVEPVV